MYCPNVQAEQCFSCACGNIKMHSDTAHHKSVPHVPANQKMHFMSCKRCFPIRDEAITLSNRNNVSFHTCSGCHKIICSCCKSAFFIFCINNTGYVGIPKDGSLDSESRRRVPDIPKHNGAAGDCTIPAAITRFFSVQNSDIKESDEVLIDGYDDFDLMFTRNESPIIGSCKNNSMFSLEDFNFPKEINTYDN